MSIKSMITHYRAKYLRWLYGPITDAIRDRNIRKHRLSDCKMIAGLSSDKKKVFYFGITQQPNLGDMAQHYCIKNWISENYPDRQLVMVESTSITDPQFTELFFNNLKKVFRPDDIIVFQSGYCTQDLGGDHPLMHRLVCERIPFARILMMPQTIYFKSEENRRICAENHNRAKNMLFLARDQHSYVQALNMFPDIRVKAFPDIVTTLIGTKVYHNERNGVCICTRNDGEKYYSYEDINNLSEKFLSDGIAVCDKDTQGKQSFKEIRNNLKKYIDEEIESYSHFKVTITDRYHGTIFSLCAGTPVIIIKTTDHKVTSGAEWFKGIYDGYVYVADSLEEAYQIAKKVIAENLDVKLKPYFKEEYYDKLKSIFDQR